MGSVLLVALVLWLTAAFAEQGSGSKCLSEFNSFANSSSATWECGSYLGYTFPTRTCISYIPLTVTEPYVWETRFDLVTAVSDLTATITSTNEWFVVTTTGTRYGDNVVFATSTTTPTVTETVTATKTKTTPGPLQTATKTVARRTTTSYLPPVLVTGPPVTAYVPIRPDALGNCLHEEVDAACSILLGPLGRIYKNITIVSTTKVHPYTLISTWTRAYESIRYTDTTLYPLSTRTLSSYRWEYVTISAGTVTFTTTAADTTKTSTVTSTKLVPPTTTLTVRASITTALIQDTLVPHRLIKLPARCDFSGPNTPLLGSTIQPNPSDAYQEISLPASDVSLCCAHCYTASRTSCLAYRFNATSSTCTILVITRPSPDQGWISSQCPLGQIGGRFLTGRLKEVGRGPCWNGMPPYADDYGNGPDLSCDAKPGGLPLPAWGS